MGFSQETIKKHTVSDGETLLSISKKYNVTPFDLQKANPGAIEGVKMDDVLIIPESKIITPRLESVADSIKTSTVKASISHTVKTGETKFGLAKRYGLTIDQLESQNPQVTYGLEIGQVLEIYPSTARKETEIEPVKTKNQSTEHRNSTEGKTHVVSSGETLYKIASALGLTVDQLEKANSNTISGILKTGQVLWIPGDSEQPTSGNGLNYTVKDGDTKFSISRHFNTSIREMERQNPHIIEILIVGQTITMSTNETNDTKSQVAPTEHTNGKPSVPMDKVEVVEDSGVANEAPDEELKAETVVVTKEEFNDTPKKEKEEQAVVVNEVVSEKKPKQEKNKTTATATKNISEESIGEEKKEEVIEEVVTADVVETSDPNYIMYQVQPSETVFGLAKKADMPIEDFLLLNPQLKESVQTGVFITMPKNKTTSNTISLVKDISNLPQSNSSYTDLRISANTSQSKRLLFFLPFSQMEYDNNAIKQDNFEEVSDDFKRIHLEFYKGANIAIDSIRKMNLNLEVDVLEAQSANQTSNFETLIQEKNIKDYDAVILPFYKTIGQEVTSFIADSDIPIITASTIAMPSKTNNLFSALPSLNQQRLKVLNHMMTKQAHVIVLSDINRIESKLLIANLVPRVDFIELKKNGSFSEDELISKFKKDQLNYVIIDSERNSVFLNASNVLLNEMSNYKLQLAVLESSLIPDDSVVSQKRYRNLKMIFPSLIPAKSTESSKQFLRTYQKKYNLLPSANTMLGFDITFDSLLRLMQPQSFESSATTDITEYTQLKFKYEKNNTLGSYTNEGIYILQYDSNANIRDAN